MLVSSLGHIDNEARHAAQRPLWHATCLCKVHAQRHGSRLFNRVIQYFQDTFQDADDGVYDWNQR